MSVGGVIDVATGEEAVHQGIHLVVRQQLAVGDGRLAGERQGQRVVGRQRVAADGGRLGQQLLQQHGGLQALDARRHTADGIAGRAERCELEAHGSQGGQQLADTGGIGRRQFDDLGEEQPLAAGGAVGELPHIVFVADAHVGTVLVDNHQARLDGGHDVATFVLIVRRGHVGREGGGSRGGGWGSDGGGSDRGWAVAESVVRGGRGGGVAEQQATILEEGRLVGIGHGGALRMAEELLPVAGGLLPEGVVLRVGQAGGHGRLVAGGGGLGVIDRQVGLALGVEVYLRNLAELADGILDGGIENLPDGLLVLKLDLGLRGVDVHIDVVGADIEIYKIRYVRAREYQSLVGLLHGLVEIGVLHIAPVDEEILVGTLLAGGLGLGGEAGDAAEGRLDMDGQQVLAVAAAIDVGDALQVVAAAQVHEFLAVAVQGEGYLGIDQHDALEGRQDIVQLGGVGLEELTAGGDVEEEVADREAAAHGTGARLVTLDTRGGQRETGAYLVGLAAGAQLDLRHGSDGRQGLATEAHGAQREEVVGLPYLRGGMPLEGQTGIGLGHAAAVVDDLDGRATGIDHQHIDGGGAGIDGILDQLLDDGSRPLYDLAGSYLVGHTIGQ